MTCNEPIHGFAGSATLNYGAGSPVARNWPLKIRAVRTHDRNRRESCYLSVRNPPDTTRTAICWSDAA